MNRKSKSLFDLDSLNPEDISEIEYLRNSDRNFKTFMMILIYILGIYFLVFSVNGSSYDDWLDLECDNLNLSFTECSNFRGSFNNYSFVQSNETTLIYDLTNDLSTNLDEFKSGVQSNFTLVYNDIDDLFILKNNISSLNQDSLKLLSQINYLNNSFRTDISNIQTSLNGLLGNSTTSGINLNDIIKVQTELFVAKETQKQIKSIFTSEEDVVFNVDRYYNKSELDLKFNNLPRPQTIDTSGFLDFKQFLTFVVVLFIGLGYFYLYQFKPLQESLRANSEKIKVSNEFKETSETSETSKSETGGLNL